MTAPPVRGAVAEALACWCGTGVWRECFRTRRFGLLRCSGCGGYRIDPPPIQSDEQSRDFYSEYYAEDGTARRVLGSQPGHEPSGFWRVAARHPELLAAKARAADIGCGDGHLCAELERTGWAEAIGVEVSRTRVAHARRRYPSIRFYDRPLAETGVEKGSLDLIVMDSVIEHLPRPVEALHGLRAYLAPAGVLVLLTPNMSSGHFRFLGRRWTGMLAPHAHIFLFHAGSLQRLFDAAGFRTLECGSYHSRLYTPGEYARRLLSGDVKGTVWRAHQEMGGIYGRIAGQGPMLYGIAQP